VGVFLGQLQSPQFSLGGVGLFLDDGAGLGRTLLDHVSKAQRDVAALAFNGKERRAIGARHLGCALLNLQRGRTDRTTFLYQLHRIHLTRNCSTTMIERG